MTVTTTPYTLDNEWVRASERLALLERQVDPATISYLDRIGVADGWHCLEVGAGGGSIAEWLSRRVGPTGSVVASDINTRFLETLVEPNLTVLKHDLVADELERETFDLVHARFVLIHLPEREAVLRKMVAAVKPGGWILIEEPDDTQFGADSSVDATARNLYDRVLHQLHGISQVRGLDIFFGSRVFGLLRALGLDAPQTEGRLQVVSGGSPEAEFWRLTFEQFGEPALAAGRVARQDFDAFLALHNDPAFALRTSLVMSCWGRKRSRE